jgi:hypothetical protein
MSGIEWLLDTSIVIGLLKERPESLKLTKGITLEQCAVSQITRMELLSFPSLLTEEQQQIEAFLSKCQILLLDERIVTSGYYFTSSRRFEIT